MMPSPMRITLTIDDDIARELNELSRERSTSFETVVNEVLRQGLTTGEKPLTAREPFSVLSSPRGFLPGIDPLKLNQLADELETEDFLSRDHS